MGQCQVEGPCLSSPNFPHNYNTSERCDVSLPHFSVIRVTNFSTERRYDRLTINGFDYSGSGLGLTGTSLVLRSNISWQSDFSEQKTGWRICVEKPVACTDGLDLVPVSIPDCPSAADPLPDCRTAEPGQLCEGDGTCGTREDINNCYHPFHTYQPTRDVYRKRSGTTTTVTRSTRTTTTLSTLTTLTLTKTTTTSTTTPLVFRTTSGGGRKWTLAGPCQVKGGCLESPNYPSSYGSNESCAASLPAFSVITIDDFHTEKYFDYLSINGYRYSGFGSKILKGTSTALWSNISWSSDGWNAGNQTHGQLRWRICVEQPVACTGGLDLIPVSIPDCPSAADPLPDCRTAEPGQLCEGDGTCGTREDINNCYDPFHTYPPTRDVYRKSNGTTRTSTSSTTWTLTSTSSTTATKTISTTSATTSTTSTSTMPWKTNGLVSYTGLCTVKDNCVQQDESNPTVNQHCAISFPNASFVTATCLQVWV